ncbi:DUF6468 domain-containing protein [Crenalkalicoccus roseus]|uniref:DUF6468 domain-containing protein n=1 Tax=Crenalkalicoccus roseus TaxID=1485588 RepID=UPI0010817C28|nr:DUF6468 domain-containing protein [Crenalkalicoccus roseus]
MGLLEWSVQILVVALLAGAMPFVLRLERELRALRRDRAALDGSAAGLAEATRLAEAASLRLRASAEASGRQVAEKLAAAEPIRDDLRYLVERAEALADRLDGLVRAARGMSQPEAPETPQAVRSRAERELLRALARTASKGS